MKTNYQSWMTAESARARRAQGRRTRRFSPEVSGTYALERRELLTIAPSDIFILKDANTNPSYPAIDGVKAVLTEVLDGANNIRYIQATFTNSSAVPRTVSLAAYRNALADPIFYGQQVLNEVVTGRVPANGTLSLRVKETPTGCTQIDAFVGPASLAPVTFTPETNAALNAKIVASEITCAPSTPGSQGLSPGYWKNHLGAWSLTALSPNLTLGQIFVDVKPGTPYASLANVKLIDALSFSGGPTVTDKAKILLRQAVTALLNATTPDIHYPVTDETILNLVHTALASKDPAAITALAGQLDAYNNLEGVTLQGIPNSKKNK